MQRKHLWGNRNQSVISIGIMSMYIDYSHFTYFHGTGSYPEPPPGRHLNNLFTARNIPLKGPYFDIASMAYCEQVGVNLQDGGNNGDMQSL